MNKWMTVTQSHKIPATRPIVNPRRPFVLSFLATFCDVKSEPLPSDGAAAAALDVLVVAVDNAPSDEEAKFDGSKVVSANVADNANDVVLASDAGARLPEVLTTTGVTVEESPIIVVVPSKITGTSTTVTCPALFVSLISIVWVVIEAIAVDDDSANPMSVSVTELESIVPAEGLEPEAIASALDITAVGIELPKSSHSESKAVRRTSRSAVSSQAVSKHWAAAVRKLPPAN
ncbi:hypothetical protein MMC15_004110 [Xylographa vitiligo]|nr:hypothetical protein [Xylographa vitiligo]